MLDWLSVAFCGVFWLCQSKVIHNDELFDPDTLRCGVELYCPERLSWFSELLETARTALQVEWDLAVAAVEDAAKKGWLTEVFVPALKRYIKIILVFGDSTKIGPAARKKKCNLIIQANPDGHVQVFSGTINDHQNRRRWKIHLGAIAARFRELEAVYNGRTIRSKEDWEATGNIYYDMACRFPGTCRSSLPAPPRRRQPCSTARSQAQIPRRPRSAPVNCFWKRNKRSGAAARSSRNKSRWKKRGNKKPNG